ncbi:YbgA family protein [Nitrosopumilus sp. K4]|uniref:YbgA family protein n=1 Tax=Nitrosopumilus sp. K4 TaxID=2795383 RepID=UPI001BAE39A3|nr:YbgA family protein [Nitrosopumilus sp. K4]QUC63984.1 YbgA family protein [Nitrosopumilus sp. K4]
MSKNQDRQNRRNIMISEEDVKQYVFERFNDVKRTKKIKDLASFQAMNKYMIMVHGQEELKKLGNIVANHKKIPFEEILEKYERHLKRAFEKHPTTKMHINVMMHIFGYFSKDFSQHEKEIFLKLLEKYRNEKITIGNMLSKINPIIFRFNNTYLASQTYFLLYSDTQSEILLQMFQTDKQNP